MLVTPSSSHQGSRTMPSTWVPASGTCCPRTSWRPTNRWPPWSTLPMRVRNTSEPGHHRWDRAPRPAACALPAVDPSRGRPARSPEQCDHLAALPAVAPGDWKDCQDHTPADGLVVFLRACLTRDYVGCCDSSRARHATAHAGATGHPVIQSAQPGESWRWCYEHSLLG